MQILALAALISAAVAVPTPQNDGRPVIGSPSGATPSGHEVQISGVSYAGSGCPANSVAGLLSSDLTTITLLYDSFVAQAGEGISAAQYRKNCQLAVKLRYPSGWQFSVFKSDTRGYAYLPKGATGTAKATYYFSGESKQTTSTLTLKGFFDNNYLRTDTFPVESTVWSPCGQEGLLNINSEVRITPLDAKAQALLTVDSTDLKFSQEHYLQWQTCK
jgi:hypothetical protein